MSVSYRPSSEALENVHVLLTDLDDTLSTKGKIAAKTFNALWQLHDAGIAIVIVTGRPAGWCDHLARFWPVEAAVGENGGFYFFHDGKQLQRRYLYDLDQRAQFRARLQTVRDRILREVPGVAIASDQTYREYDIAIDFCEDVPRLSDEQVLRIKCIFEESGATARVSSIHVNGWFGTFDKLTSVRLCAKERLGINPDHDPEKFIYCGDSPNDEPMFKFFPLSFGMSNIRPFLPLMKHKPAFITPAPCGTGFQEVAEMLLSVRKQP